MASPQNLKRNYDLRFPGRQTAGFSLVGSHLCSTALGLGLSEVLSPWWQRARLPVANMAVGKNKRMSKGKKGGKKKM